MIFMMTKFCTLLLMVLLAGVAGCTVPHYHAAKAAPQAPGLYFTYFKDIPTDGVDTAVVGPATTEISPLYFNISDTTTPQVFDQIIREDASSVIVSFTYGDSSTARETIAFSKTMPTRVILAGGLQVTGNYRK